MDELLEIYDENNIDLNYAEERRIVHEKGLYHREVCIFILNHNNELLIQKRSAMKKNKPNIWGLCAGHIDVGETEVQAALRELNEELGLKNIKQDDLILFNIEKKTEIDPIKNIRNNYFNYCYILKIDLKEDEFIIQKEELSEVKYIAFDKLLEISTTNPEKYKKSLKGELLKNNYKKLIKKLKEIKGG